jgi:hypothetical protein
VVDGRTLTFEVAGLLDGVLTMVDRETGTVWTHLDGKAIRGPMAGERLTMVPIPQMTWGDWRAASPDTLVLSADTPFSNRYGSVRIGVYSPSEARFGDERLRANALVVGVEVDGRFKGYAVEALAAEGGLVNDGLGGRPILVLYDADARTGIAFSRVLDGRALEFAGGARDGRLELRDLETGSTWDLRGRATSGPLAGKTLDFVPSFISEWYGWSAYHPESALFALGP